MAINLSSLKTLSIKDLLQQYNDLNADIQAGNVSNKIFARQDAEAILAEINRRGSDTTAQQTAEVRSQVNPNLLVQNPVLNPDKVVTTSNGSTSNDPYGTHTTTQVISGKDQYKTAVSEHDAAVTAQENASKGHKGIFGSNLFAAPPTPKYGFTEDEWAEKTEFYKEGVRKWAHDQAGQFITVPESDTWTRYVADGNPAPVDTLFGPKYKYKAFFQSVQDLNNSGNFQAAEQERSDINGAMGYINPKQPQDLKDLETRFVKRASNSYSGCDIIPSITIGGTTFVIGNLSAISYSVHRDKVPVRTLGRTYAKSYVSGGATIAGTLIFTVFDTHVLDEIRKYTVTEVQAAGGQSSPLTQQLPPFDVTVYFQNEYGHASYMRIYGLEITDEAQTHSINDVYSENQMQYIARDIDLMTRVGDIFTPQALAGGNSSIFTQYKSPGYRLQHLAANEKEQGELTIDVARLNSEIKNYDNKIAQLQKTTPQTAEITNTINSYTIQRTALVNQRDTKSQKIEALKVANDKLTVEVNNSADINLGSDFSAGRDDPFALSRTSPLAAKSLSGTDLSEASSTNKYPTGTKPAPGAPIEGSQSKADPPPISKPAPANMNYNNTLAPALSPQEQQRIKRSSEVI